MPIRTRPINPNMLATSEDSLRRSSKVVSAKKYNYSSLYVDNGIDLGNFSFFGNGKSPLDFFGESTNLFYGRIDGNGDSISPKLTSLMQI